jgi:hypothetical protein
VPACDSIDWIGCYTGGASWKIWLRSGRFTICEAPNSMVNGCYLAKRVILHEAEHLVSGVGEFAQSPATTNMSAGFNTSRPNLGWDSQTPKPCDEAMLQLVYGVRLVSGPIADCFDHILNHGATGLKTSVTLSRTAATVCSGQSASLSARLFVQNISSYMKIANSNLGARLLYVDRKLSTSSTWTLGVASQWTSATGGTSYNWTRGFTQSPAVKTTYHYRLRFVGGPGVDPVTSATFAVTYLVPCPIL